MARKKVNPDDVSGEKKAAGSGPISQTRKMEILGIIIMSLGVLIGISVLTYSASDYTPLSKVTLDSMFAADSGPALRIKNGLGPIGAWLGHFFVYLGFGYATLVIPVLMFIYGWFVFRAKEVSNLSWGAVYSLLMMVLFSMIASWFRKTLNYSTLDWCGTAGDGITTLFYTLLSPIGSGIIYFVLTVISLLFLVDRDIQTTIDRIKEKIQEYRERAQEKAGSVVESIQEKAASKKTDTLENQNDELFAEPKVIRKVTPQKPEILIPKSVVEEQDPTEYVEEYDAERVLQESIERERARLAAKQTEKEDYIGKRAVIERPTPKPAEPEYEEELEEEELKDIEPEVTVYVGEEEKAAGKSDLKKMQHDSLDQVPLIKFKFPTIDLLDSPPNEGKEVDMEEINENKRIILDKLKRHGIEIIAIDAIVGPTVTLYELTPAPDVKISKIESYANDLKMALSALGIRIIAPIPGKSAVGIEVPNQTRETVYIKQIINTKKFVESKMDLPIAFGKTIENEVFMVDLAKCPHLLVAGATGSGKSVGVNTIITCLLYKCHPDNLKFVLVDPKKIELALYKSLERHYLATLPNMEEPIITDTSKVLEVLTSVCKEMDDRYDLLKLAMVRDLKAYNEKFKNGTLDHEKGHRHLPYIVVIIDELADLMMTAGKQVEEPIARLAQLARAIGIHLVVATQRPSVNVITGTIKANFPSRIAYQVASKIDSRTILDTMGADQLVGRGDMLYSGGGPMIRVQNAFVSTEEVERINEFIGTQMGYNTPYFLPVVESEEDQDIPSLDRGERDALFDEAAKVIVLHQQGSVSLLQRKLRLGYNRAGRLIDQLYASGIVGPYQGSTAREVLVKDEVELDEILRGLD